jgi:molecular chaperone GrpE
MEEASNPANPEAGNGADAVAAAAEPVSPLEQVTAERDQALAERAELWDRFLRKQAEFENFRRRMGREREEIVQFAAMETIRSLLPVLDDFERALKAPAEGDDYRKGIELIYKRLYDTLAAAGVAPIEAAGKKFDPHAHQAVDTVKSEEHEDHTVIEEYQRGYEFKGRLLRPAMVKVAVRE